MLVQMYHPLIPSTSTNPARVALSSVDDHAARGWLLVDPDVIPPAPESPYPTRAEADSRYVARTAVLDNNGKVRETVLPARLSEDAQRAAFGLWLEEEGGDLGSGVTDGAASGQVLVWDGDSWEPIAPAEATAADVPFVPTGTISATNVQSAIQEVAAEAAAAGGASYRSPHNAVQNLIGSTMAASSASNTYAMGAGIVHYSRFIAEVDAPLSKIYMQIIAAGGGLTAGIVHLKNAAGETLAVADDQAANWMATGTKIATLSAPVQVTAGQAYYVALLAIGTSGPQIPRGSNSGAHQAGTVAGSQATTTSGSGQTSIPTSTNFAALPATGGNAVWVGFGA